MLFAADAMTIIPSPLWPVGTSRKSVSGRDGICQEPASSGGPEGDVFSPRRVFVSTSPHRRRPRATRAAGAAWTAVVR